MLLGLCLAGEHNCYLNRVGSGWGWLYCGYCFSEVQRKGECVRRIKDASVLTEQHVVIRSTCFRRSRLWARDEGADTV